MQPSDKLFEFLKDRERLELRAYKPTPNDVWTIGYGHTKGAFQGQEITPTEANHYLVWDVADAVHSYNSTVKTVLKQNEYDAIISLLFNIPFNQWRSSKALVALNNRDFDTFLVEAFSAQYGWTRQNGEVLQGLVNRRRMEWDIFVDGIYAA